MLYPDRNYTKGFQHKKRKVSLVINCILRKNCMWLYCSSDWAEPGDKGKRANRETI